MAKKQYTYQSRSVAATPRNRRLADTIQEVADSGGAWNGSGTGSSAPATATFDLEAGPGIVLEKNEREFDNRLAYTVSHADTSFLDPTANEGIRFVQNLTFDDFGHVTDVGSARITDGLDGRYLRKDIDDTAHGEILFDRRVGSSVFLDGMKGKGWEMQPSGAAQFDAATVRGNAIVGRRAGSEIFVSGFPNGLGWDLGPTKRFNAAATEETKYRLELDDLVVRGQLRLYELVVSKLRGENDNVIFAGQMKVAFYDPATRRLYLDTDRGILYNPFRRGDVLMVQRFGGLPSAGNQYNVIKQYELRVDEAEMGSFSDGEDRLDWITFSNLAGSLSDIAAGDVLTRVDSVTDASRKGVVKITTIDEAGAPAIDVAYGLKTDPGQATKVRLGNLSGLRTRHHADLTGVWGLYAQGAVLENSTIYLDNGRTVEQEFSVLNGEFNSKIEAAKNDLSLEPGNLLKNSSFATDLHDWSASANQVHFIRVGGAYLWMDDSFYVEKEAVADLYQDGGKQVLRLRSGSLRQKNAVMKGEKLEGTYSFSFFCKVLRAGTLSAGMEGTELFLQEPLEVSEAYQKRSLTARWTGTGDFVLRFTGEILIYGVSLFNDALADATLKLQTQINQNAERISLTASKEYVDELTNQIYLKYDSELKVQADEISQRVTKTEYVDGTNAIKREWESKFSVQADRISAVSTAVDNVNHTISSAGWITSADANTFFASKTLEDGNRIISFINQTATTITIHASKIDLQGKVTFSMFDDSLSNQINGKADSASLKSLAYADKVEQAQLGETIVSGGYIRTDLMDADLILANAASIGGFDITREGIQSVNKYTTSDSDNKFFLYSSGSSGFLGFSATNVWAGLGLNVLPASLGGVRALLRLENKKGSSLDTNYGAVIDVRNGARNKALDCIGGFRVKGAFATAKLAPSCSHTDDIINNIGYKDAYIYQVTQFLQVLLPTPAQIKNGFGQIYNDFNGNYVDITNSAWIEITIFNNRWSTQEISVEGVSTAPLVDQNGEVSNHGNTESGIYGSRRLGKGDCLKLAFHNNMWYTMFYSN